MRSLVVPMGAEGARGLHTASRGRGGISAERVRADKRGGGSSGRSV